MANIIGLTLQRSKRVTVPVMVNADHIVRYFVATKDYDEEPDLTEILLSNGGILYVTEGIYEINDRIEAAADFTADA